MTDALLTINAGSSSIKFALFQHGDPVPILPELMGEIDGIGAAQGAHVKTKNKAGRVLDDTDLALSGEGQHRAAIDYLTQWLRDQESGWRIAAIGHRVVHGGESYSHPIRLNESHIRSLRKLIPLAPLHQPHNLAGIEAMHIALPGIPQIACFDTAFHRTQPRIAQLYALPQHITAQGVRRYGFHGLSYEYIADVLPQYLPPTQADGRVIVAHLGNGASMCAMRGRKSQATTMGFTALEGLVMGTRAGTIDPGILLYLMEYGGMDAKALTRLLYKESGLLGVSGISQDMRELLASKMPEAKEAIELFCYRIVCEIGSLAAAIGGIDALVFTGGIGAYAAPVRETVCRQLGWLGLELDVEFNASHATHISTPGSRVAAMALPTNEEWMLARHTAELL